MSTLPTPDAISAFLRQLPGPIVYLSTTTFNLIGAERWVGGLEFITTTDCFAGRHPHIAIPDGAGRLPLGAIEAANRFLVGHPDVQQRLRGRGPGHALFMMFDDECEAAVERVGWRVALPPARLRRHLDSKVTTTELGDRAGVPSVPNVLAPVRSYAELRRAAGHLGADLVVQLPYGNSGATTFFVSSEADYAPHAAAIAAQPAVKVMRRIRCRQATIEGCVTRHGTLAGPLQTELVGLPQLTPLPGGWCGNELVAGPAGPFAPATVRQALDGVAAIGAELRRAGYWGVFGLDFLLDVESGELYLGELNPRITGATPLTSQAALDEGLPPLLAFHLLEALGADYAIDVAAYNQRWLDRAAATGWSQLIVEHLAPQPALVGTAPAAGAWRLEDAGAARFLRPILAPQDLAGDDEVFAMPTVQAGQVAPPGYSLIRLLMRGRAMGDDWALNERARAMVRAMRATIELAPAAA